eukprot:1160434-Pelagomonas_calceolata.AAC.6
MGACLGVSARRARVWAAGGVETNMQQIIPNFQGSGNVMFNVVANVSAWLYTVCRECVSPDLSKESELNTLPAVLAVSGLYVTHAIVADAVVDRGDLLVRMNELFDLPCHLLFPLKHYDGRGGSAVGSPPPFPKFVDTRFLDTGSTPGNSPSSRHSPKFVLAPFHIPSTLAAGSSSLRARRRSSGGDTTRNGNSGSRGGVTVGKSSSSPKMGAAARQAQMSGGGGGGAAKARSRSVAVGEDCAADAAAVAAAAAAAAMQGVPHSIRVPGQHRQTQANLGLSIDYRKAGVKAPMHKLQ